MQLAPSAVSTERLACETEDKDLRLVFQAQFDNHLEGDP